MQLHSATSLVAYQLPFRLCRTLTVLPRVLREVEVLDATNFMKLIFLDVDGVFVTEKFVRKEFARTGKPQGRTFDPEAVAECDRILAATGADIVVSSVWRMGRSLDELDQLFKDQGFKNARIVGKTGITSHGVRGREIQDYLNTLSIQPDKFAIIDDDSDMEHLTPLLFKTSWVTGLTPQIADKVIEFLNG